MPDERSWTVRRAAEPEPSLPVKLFSYVCLVVATSFVGAIGAAAIFHLRRHEEDASWMQKQRARDAIRADTYEAGWGRAKIGAVGGAILGVILVVAPLATRKGGA